MHASEHSPERAHGVRPSFTYLPQIACAAANRSRGQWSAVMPMSGGLGTRQQAPTRPSDLARLERAATLSKLLGPVIRSHRTLGEDGKRVGEDHPLMIVMHVIFQDISTSRCGPVDGAGGLEMSVSDPCLIRSRGPSG
jgi:hypothetical protein